jgi:diguanylate cyclase (GGDEF)-like protein
VRDAADSTDEATQLQFTVSIGVAEVGEHEDVLAILRRVDEALYAAKASGRNRVVKASKPATLG